VRVKTVGFLLGGGRPRTQTLALYLGTTRHRS
jgi:hypothetical protein